MNNKIKIVLGLIAGGSLIYFGLKKKNGKLKSFTAPDGNTYDENQVYRTYDNKFYKNGKQIRFNIPESQEGSKSLHHFQMNNEKTSKNQVTNQNISYHQKGIRHH